MTPRLLLLSFIISASISSAEDANPVYHVADIAPDSPKFLRIAAAIQASLDRGFFGMNPEIEFAILGHIEGGKHLIRRDQYIFLFDFPDGKTRADGSNLKIRVETSGKVFQYTAVSGAKKSVKIVTEKKRSKFKPSLLYASLKDGDVYTVKGSTWTPCRPCMGIGLVAGNATKTT